jgi:hypothetical protein
LCPDCGSQLVGFTVPTTLRDEAPDDTGAATLCSQCLRVRPLSDDHDATDADTAVFDAVADYFPDGAGGVAFALALGRLDSLALHRASIQRLVERAEREGVDVLLTLDRLAEDPSLDPYVDVTRRREQLARFLA